MEVFEPVAVVWMLPTLGSAIGLIFGAAAFIALHRDLARQAPRLAATSTTLAAVTLGAALVTAATVVTAMARAELPGGIALASIPVALLGFVRTGALVSIAALVTDALPRLVAATLGFAIALTLALVGYVNDRRGFTRSARGGSRRVGPRPCRTEPRHTAGSTTPVGVAHASHHRTDRDADRSPQGRYKHAPRGSGEPTIGSGSQERLFFRLSGLETEQQRLRGSSVRRSTASDV